MRGIFSWGNNTGATAYNDAQGRRRFVRYGHPGSPDIIGITAFGTFIGIEVKTGKAVQNQKQKEFQGRIDEYAGHYIVARNLDDVEDLLKEAGI